MPAVDLEALVGRLSILTKDLTVERIQLNWAQQEYIDVALRQLVTTGRIRIIVLKARQLGISTITEALLYVLCFIYENYKAMVIAHEVPASQNLLAMTQRYWDTDPHNRLYSTKYAGRNHLQWTETGSGIHVATAGNKGVGRSATIHALHASEVAFWPDPEIVMTGLRQTIPSTAGTCIVLESTANGMGNYFHTMWEDAVAGDTEFEALFFPWHRHPEYLASAVGPAAQRPLGTLDGEEKQLRAMGLSDDRLQWRRWAIRELCQNDLLKFKQEYPATAEEAFIASGTNVFPLEHLNAVYEPLPGVRGVLLENSKGVQFKRSPDGPLTVWRGPSSDESFGEYMVAGDPTHTMKGDYACAQVLNRRTLEQVAEWRGRIDPVGFADVLFSLGKYYNTALVTSEIEGGGYGTIGALLAKNYPRIWQNRRPDSTPGKPAGDRHGWSTTAQSKHTGMGWLKNVIVNHDLTIHSKTLFAEMKNYVVLADGGYGPASTVSGHRIATQAPGGEEAGSRGHDDTVMAMMIGVVCHMMETPPMPYEGSGAQRPGSGEDYDDGLSGNGYDAPWETVNG